MILLDTTHRVIFKYMDEVNITEGPAGTKLGFTMYIVHQDKCHACTVLDINNETILKERNDVYLHERATPLKEGTSFLCKTFLTS